MAMPLWSFCRILMLYYVLCLINITFASNSSAVVNGFRAEDSSFSNMVDGTLYIFAGQDVPLRLFGSGFSAATEVAFTTAAPGSSSNDCTDMAKSRTYMFSPDGLTSVSAKVEVNLPHLQPTFNQENYYVCIKQTVESILGQRREIWIHQGVENWVTFKTKVPEEKKSLLPMWLQGIIISILLCLSGLFSGLNLGLMALDKTELKIIERCGSSSEKRYAKVIAPLRKRGNFLLCSLLLGNVLVNNTLTILLDDLTSGMVAIIGATFGIVVFGEIIPQAVCSRHGLAVGAKTIWITKFFMLLTFPISYPISKLLDLVLGEEIGHVYNREKLQELITVTKDFNVLEKDEVNIISGALSLTKKMVKDIMTPLSDAFLLDYNAILDFQTMSDIMKRGYTRIPVYETSKSAIVGILNIKDLAFVDADDKTPLRTVCKFYNHPVNFVFEDVKLDAMLEEFRKGQSHMAFVQHIVTETEGDPYYETVGLVTLEDVIEEIIQAEIVDETDTITDNLNKKPRTTKKQDFTEFNAPGCEKWEQMSPQLALATFQFMSTSVEPFKAEMISEVVLQRLLRQNIILSLRYEDKDPDHNIIFERGKPCDYFVLVLQGRVSVIVGKENLMFEGGPFTFFGLQALQSLPSPLARANSCSSISSLGPGFYAKQPTYTPDFTVKALSDVQYMKIKRAHYIAARKATLMERSSKHNEYDPFSKEWAKVSSMQHHCGSVDGHSETGDRNRSESFTPSVDFNISMTRDDDKEETGSVTSESNMLTDRYIKDSGLDGNRTEEDSVQL
ncbi:metal transporter CNNM4-like [Tubulanus polymorphus]|uniref:metal transporter CNNM4-like n=1 Tax=Tubulanus polymorphus TaxID=672921 RepID=UPI003DA3094A